MIRSFTILYVGDQERSTEFYGAVLDREPRLNVPGMTEFEMNDGAMLGLMPVDSAARLLGDGLPEPPAAGGGPRVELYLLVENPGAHLERAFALGARLVSPLQERDWGDRAGYCLDPDGHVLAFAESMDEKQAPPQERAIRGVVTVPAPLGEVWEAWTTPQGIQSFFAPHCNVEPFVDGPYEIIFDPDEEPGSRGSEGMRIMAIQPEVMLAFTWNAPPHLTEIREQMTHVVVRFRELSEEKTQVTLTHDGWGEGGEWDETFTYFEWAWNSIVLPRLVHSFVEGPIDWSDPPVFDKR